MQLAKACRSSVARASSTMTAKAAPLLSSVHNLATLAQISVGHPASCNSLDATSASRPCGARIRARSEFGPPKGIKLLDLSLKTLLRARKSEHHVEVADYSKRVFDDGMRA